MFSKEIFVETRRIYSNPQAVTKAAGMDNLD